ncbi:hypothetical protein EGI11_03145 [Chryseobacterium sp. H3056]|uniref:Uncharacterized protein n=1 Tax=Kaistella daneshvariae TaxID=2487074 RepID=A0A3N0WXE9_9FLAO|nr:hypothetical protein [Kaistella daneshvariae]ROI09767.1 hypothetical protein EGI11_03145 [Kaistella daneshvariae]
MNRYTERPRTTEQEVLALDSIYKILTANERILLHRSQHKNEAEITEKIFKLLKWVEKTGWKSPYMKYPEWHHDVLHYEDENGKLLAVETYPRAHQEITEQILKLKIS